MVKRLRISSGIALGAILAFLVKPRPATGPNPATTPRPASGPQAGTATATACHRAETALRR